MALSLLWLHMVLKAQKLLKLQEASNVIDRSGCCEVHLQM